LSWRSGQLWRISGKHSHRFAMNMQVSFPLGVVRVHVPSLLAACLWLAGLHPACALGPSRTLPLLTEWRFRLGDSPDLPCVLAYDEPLFGPAPDRPSGEANRRVVRLKPWILPTANRFLGDNTPPHRTPERGFDCEIPCTLPGYDDSTWQVVRLPHDWAIAGPFDASGRRVGGEMGRLPSPGVGWYRRRFELPAAEAGRRVFLEVEGAMAYAAVWLNGHLVGGWPYGYASWSLDLTPWVRWGRENILAIRLENPPRSSRWYPGGGLYRSVHLRLAPPVYVDPWGVFVRTPQVSHDRARVRVETMVVNETAAPVPVEVRTTLHRAEADGRTPGRLVARMEPVRVVVPAGSRTSVVAVAEVKNPKLWGPPPTQQPHLHVAVTTLRDAHGNSDRHVTVFGIRDVQWDPERGLILNGERIPIRGVNLHHDLGPLGAAFYPRAAERQLEILREMGGNAIRTAHNPPAPGLLELTDRLGFLVLDEIFDCWERRKTPNDFHRIFPEWHEADLRAFVRRDRNHPSVILWSIGNEVGEQYTGEAGAAVARRLYQIVKEEDPTRLVTCAMNWAKPDMPLPAVLDVIGLNYQGEGIRDTEPYADSRGIRTPPLHDAFRRSFPDKPILSTETAATVSTRGTYLFPVTPPASAPVREGAGGDRARGYVSAYELYTADFGASPDKVFATLARHPFVAGQFVWSGFDYLGEPTPYDASRSSYFGIVDLAGFPKDRYYLYQSQWRPDLPMVHLLPHWSWPERVGEVTPVHVFTTGDEVELFLNGRSLGRKRKGPGEVRLRWDDVVYEPGALRAVAYRNGRVWATAEARTAGTPARLELRPDRAAIQADGQDLCFVTVRLTDAWGTRVPRTPLRVHFEVAGPAEIVATDNGDPTDFEPFPSSSRRVFNGLCLVVIRGRAGEAGRIRLTARADGLPGAELWIRSLPTRRAQD